MQLGWPREAGVLGGYALGWGGPRRSGIVGRLQGRRANCARGASMSVSQGWQYYYIMHCAHVCSSH